MQIGFIFIVLFLLFTKDLHSATISHQAQNTTVTHTDDFEVDVNFSISAADGTEYYLRGVFYQPGDNDYCGYTWNGNTYFSGPYSTNEQWKNFHKIIVTNGTWTGKLKAKIDPEDSGCRKSGEYKFKIQRFTSSGGGTFDDQSETTLNMTVPTQTPTPHPTEKPTQTPKPIKNPTSTPSPKSPTQATSSNTTVLKVTMSDEENAALTKNTLQGKDVYGANTSSTKNPTKTNSNQEGGSNSEENITPTNSEENETKKGGSPWVYLGGASMLAGCGILLFQAYRKRNGK